MLRSLLIGFLILSALASKGAEAQIIKNYSNIPAEMLLELFNAVTAQSDKTAEFSSTDVKEAFFSYARIGGKTIESISGKTKNSNQFNWFEQNFQTSCHLHYTALGSHSRTMICKEAFLCVSGLSPPYSL